MNTKALTSPQKNQSIKWKSSIFRLYADLMELWCENEECEAVRVENLNRVKKQIKEGVFTPW